MDEVVPAGNDAAVLKAKLHKDARTAFLTSILVLMFLGVPIAALLVPFAQVGAALQGHRTNKQLRAIGEPNSTMGSLAIWFGIVLAILSAIIVLGRISEILGDA